MAAANPAESLREEVSCPICLDYYLDPVMIHCGHNFCRSCITQTWEGRHTDFFCPQCRKRSRHRNLRLNWQLANVTENVKKLSQFSVIRKEENLCEKHEEKLKLFCEEEQRAICVVCRESRDHRSHPVIPIEEAVQEYKKKLEIHLEPMKKGLEDLLKFKSAEEKKAEKLRSETEMKRQKVESEFEELHQLLNKEKQILLSRLEEEEKKIVQRIRQNVILLEEQISSLTQLISELEEKSQQLDTELLKDMKNFLIRCQKLKFPKPKVVLTDLKMGFSLSYPEQLKKLITKSGGLDWWMECGRYAVNVTLDPETAHPYLVLSEDRKSVRFGKRRQKLLDNPERFNYNPCVLGYEGFTVGRHYWEVEVEDGTRCMLGVCKDSVRRWGEITVSPKEGYWAVELWYAHRYCAVASAETELPLSESLRTVGILLDYEAGKVSFYDADNKSHLFTFPSTFTGKLRPFFYTCNTLRIRPVPVQELNSDAQD